MKRKVKKIVKITTIPIIVFAVGNMLVYLYCLITPKIELNKSQSYYLYDNIPSTNIMEYIILSSYFCSFMDIHIWNINTIHAFWSIYPRPSKPYNNSLKISILHVWNLLCNRNKSTCTIQ